MTLTTAAIDRITENCIAISSMIIYAWLSMFHHSGSEDYLGLLLANSRDRLVPSRHLPGIECDILDRLNCYSDRMVLILALPLFKLVFAVVGIELQLHFLSLEYRLAVYRSRPNFQS